MVSRASAALFLMTGFTKLLADSHPTALEKAIDAVTLLAKYSKES